MKESIARIKIFIHSPFTARNLFALCVNVFCRAHSFRSLHLACGTPSLSTIVGLPFSDRLAYLHPIDLISIAVIHVEIIEIFSHHNFTCREQIIVVWKAPSRKINPFRLERNSTWNGGQMRTRMVSPFLPSPHQGKRNNYEIRTKWKKPWARLSENFSKRTFSRRLSNKQVIQENQTLALRSIDIWRNH